MKTDRLFLTKGCLACSTVRVVLNDSHVEDDTHFGKNGHRLFVFSSFSSDAGRELLDHFGLGGYDAPVLLLEDGWEAVSDVGEIIQYLRQNDFGG